MAGFPMSPRKSNQALSVGWASNSAWPTCLMTARSEDHEVNMLALHLLQNCMVYINTLMLQRCWRSRSEPTSSPHET